jgi:hypothetical protein
VITNGRHLSDRGFAEQMVVSGATGIGFSIFGATAAVHDEAMGAPGAWDDLLAGVRNLAALGALGRDSAVSCTAQFTLYARNYHQLPDMMHVWYGEGFRSFVIHLLRETENTRNTDPGSWFFDLAELTPLVERCLEFALARPELFISFSALPYCLVDRRDLGLVLRDIPTNPRVRERKTIFNRHRQLTRKDGKKSSESFRLTDPHAGCRTCDLVASCAKVDVPYAQPFSGTVRPIDLQLEIAQWATTPVDDENFSRLALLATMDEQLRDLGVEAQPLQRLRDAVDQFAAQRRASDPTFLIREQRMTARDVLLLGRSRRTPTQFRWIEVADTPPEPAHDDDALRTRWAELRASHADGNGSGYLVDASRSWAMFAAISGNGGPDTYQVTVTTLYDRRHVDQATLQRGYEALASDPPRAAATAGRDDRPG